MVVFVFSIVGPSKDEAYKLLLKGNFALAQNILLVTCSHSMFTILSHKAHNSKVALHLLMK